MMKNFYIDRIEENQTEHPGVFNRVLAEMFGPHVTWQEVKWKHKETHIKLMCALDNEIKIKESPYCIEKIAHAIQESRSGMGGCAMTKHVCVFCGKEEMWSNTNTPNICHDCATTMARNIVKRKMELLK